MRAEDSVQIIEDSRFHNAFRATWRCFFCMLFQDGIGRLFKSEEEVERGMRRNNISETNYVSLTTSSHPGFPSSFIAVPISIAEKRIGVMTVHQWRGKQPFDEHDLLLLQGFAEQAAGRTELPASKKV
ncbi:GAF domain-containing protein [Sporosarcina sp. FSL W7-1349]|uniref:GAF domain-containing protein n=1 Tax=Sporosarcina sp. FSL W7-1349 TaxID=2921561 RepID=UPI0030F8B225